MRDLRKYARQTNFRLIVGGILLTLMVGGGLIYAYYGAGGMWAGLGCMLAALVPVGLVWLILEILGWAVKKVNEDD